MYEWPDLHLPPINLWSLPMPPKKQHLWSTECSCLDSAYERSAVEKGLNRQPVFPENDFQKYYKGTLMKDDYLTEFTEGLRIRGNKKPPSYSSAPWVLGAHYEPSNVVRAVEKKFEEREVLGISKYGTTMDRNDLKDAQWLQHAQEETMDLCLYLERLIQARKKDG